MAQRGQPPAADPVLGEMVTQLVRALAPERIYLFGSRARGDATEESDYDLLVVVGGEAGAHPHHALARLAYHALAGVGVPKDIVVMTRGRFEWLRGAAASLPATVVREGRLLYVA